MADKQLDLEDLKGLTRSTSQLEDQMDEEDFGDSTSSLSVTRRRSDFAFDRRHSSFSSLGDISTTSSTSDHVKRPTIARSQSERVPRLERSSSTKGRMLTGTTNAYYHKSIFAPTPDTVAQHEKLERNELKDKSTAAVDFLRQLCTRHDSTRNLPKKEDSLRNLYESSSNENLKRRKSWDGLTTDIEVEIAAERNRSPINKCLISIQESFSSTVLYMRIRPKVCITLTFCLLAAVVCTIVVLTQGKQSTPSNITVGASDSINIVNHEQQIKLLSSFLKSSPLLKDADNAAYDNPDSPQHKAIVWVTSHIFPSNFTKFQNGILVKPGDGMMVSLMYTRNNGIPTGTFDDYFRIEAVMERYALAVLYYSTLGINETFAEFITNSGNEHFALSHENVCEWKGVICHEFHDIVSHLDMGSSLLYGTLPPELAYLRSLKSINFSNNSLFGEIPVDYGTFPSIESIQLHRNYLSGTMPENICKMRSLGRLKNLTSDCADNNNLFEGTGIKCDCCTNCI